MVCFYVIIDMTFYFYVLTLVFSPFFFVMAYRWLSENYDGMRCFWKPSENQMYPLFLTSLSPPSICLALVFSLTRKGILRAAMQLVCIHPCPACSVEWS
jgi:hypothetical protein